MAIEMGRLPEPPKNANGDKTHVFGGRPGFAPKYRIGGGG